MCIKGFVNRLSHDCHIDWSQKSIYKSFPPLTAGLYQAIVRIVTIYLGELIVTLWLLVIGVSQTSLMIGGFRSKAWLALLEEETVPSAVFCGKDRLLGIHALGISISLSLLMLLGWSLMWIASLTRSITDHHHHHHHHHLLAFVLEQILKDTASC